MKYGVTDRALEATKIMVTLAILAGLVVGGYAIGVQMGIAIGIGRVAEQVALIDEVPTIESIQRSVGATVDGKLCRMWNVPGHSETQEKWEYKLGNQSASKWDYHYAPENGMDAP